MASQTFHQPHSKFRSLDLGSISLYFFLRLDLNYSMYKPNNPRISESVCSATSGVCEKSIIVIKTYMNHFNT